MGKSQELRSWKYRASLEGRKESSYQRNWSSLGRGTHALMEQEGKEDAGGRVRG
jgi:hypothetical protein